MRYLIYIWIDLKAVCVIYFSFIEREKKRFIDNILVTMHCVYVVKLMALHKPIVCCWKLNHKWLTGFHINNNNNINKRAK